MKIVIWEFHKGGIYCGNCERWQEEINGDLFAGDFICIECGVQNISGNNYKLYLRSERWKTLAQAVKTIAENRCQICASEDNLEVHHRRYDNKNKPKEIRDLVCLCHSCHQKFHGK